MRTASTVGSPPIASVRNPATISYRPACGNTNFFFLCQKADSRCLWVNGCAPRSRSRPSRPPSRGARGLVVVTALSARVVSSASSAACGMRTAHRSPRPGCPGPPGRRSALGCQSARSRNGPAAPLTVQLLRLDARHRVRDLGGTAASVTGARCPPVPPFPSPTATGLTRSSHARSAPSSPRSRNARLAGQSSGPSPPASCSTRTVTPGGGGAARARGARHPARGRGRAASPPLRSTARRLIRKLWFRRGGTLRGRNMASVTQVSRAMVAGSLRIGCHHQGGLPQPGSLPTFPYKGRWDSTPALSSGSYSNFGWGKGSGGSGGRPRGVPVADGRGGGSNGNFTSFSAGGARFPPRPAASTGCWLNG